MSKINIILFFFLAPLIVLFLVIYGFNNQTEKYFYQMENYIGSNSFLSIESIDKDNFNVNAPINTSVNIVSNLNNSYNEYNEIIKEISSSIYKINKQSTLTLMTYDYLVDFKLGNSIYENYTNNYKLNIYNIENGTYKGYIAKIKLFNPNYFKLKIANNTLGEKLPTSEIAKNNNAILAINGGGFFKTSLNDKPFTQTVGATISNGNLISSSPVDEEGFFVSGIDINGHLTGETLNSQTDVEKINIYEGVSFVPILLKNKEKQPIPVLWRNKFHPRTIIGNFANEDLFIMVIDGRQPGYSSGITLENVQERLIKFGIIDAYNLDGGGSSAFYYDSSLLNKPSDNYERPVPNAFILLR